MIFRSLLLLSILYRTVADDVDSTLKSFVCHDEILNATALKMVHLETAMANLHFELNVLKLIMNREFSNLNKAIAATDSQMATPDVLSQQPIWDSKPTTIEKTSDSNTKQPPYSVGNTPTTITTTAAETNSNNKNQPFCPAGCMPNTTDDETSSSKPTTTAAGTIFSNAKIPASITDDYTPSSCEEALKLSGRSNELYLLRMPDSQIKPFYVNCLEDPEHDGGAWIIIQRRIDGNIDFFRTWRDYQQGFGNLETEFFIGLDKLYALTNSGKHELWIKMEDFEQNKRYAKYSSFAIGHESQAYALIMLGNYTGNAGDSLTPHAGEKFSTKDVDNDSHDKMNCAVQYEGAWWYKKCHKSNLNGRYLIGTYPRAQFGKGIDWYTWHEHTYSLKYVHMAIRPINMKL